jgi:hypothetical protein
MKGEKAWVGSLSTDHFGDQREWDRFLLLGRRVVIPVATELAL